MFDREQVLDWLKTAVPRHRLQHILGVEKTAAQLAYHHHLDMAKAARAGLLHDLAKYYGAQKLLSEAIRYHIPLDPITRANPHLLHAPVSAAVAQELFDEQEDDVLQAIANHTLGEPGMDNLSCALYVADWIEPMRTGEELVAMRAIAFTDLKKTVLLGCNATIEELLAQERPIHPRTIATRNWLISLIS